MSLSLDTVSLATYPGPALMIGMDGAMEAMNIQGRALRTILASDHYAQAMEMCGRAVAGQAVVEIVTLGGREHGQSLEITMLPTNDGAVLVLGRDITLERNLRVALVESRQRYKDLVEISSDFAWEIGTDGRFAFVSPKGALGHAADALVGQYPDDYVIATTEREGPLPFRTTEKVEDVEVWMRTITGEEACLMASASPLFGPRGDWIGSRGVCRDVTVERVREVALARANSRERLLTYIVRTIRDVVDPGDMLGAAAEATGRALGATGCRIYRRDPDGEGAAPDTMTLGAHWGVVAETSSSQTADDLGADKVMCQVMAEQQMEAVIDGWHVLGTISRYHNAVNGAVCLWRDPDCEAWSDDERLLISDVANQIGIANEQIANHDRIVKLSRTDGLTGQYNRRAFFEQLERRFQRLERDPKPAALIYLDLDNFKAVNDVHGHQAGDDVLLKVRDLLQHHTRPVDLVARLGGDEFAIWLEGADDRIAIGRAEKLLEAATALEAYSGSPDRPLHVSLGVAVYDPQRPESLAELLERADQAMYEVKRDGKAAYRVAPAAAGGH